MPRNPLSQPSAAPLPSGRRFLEGDSTAYRSAFHQGSSGKVMNISAFSRAESKCIVFCICSQKATQQYWLRKNGDRPVQGNQLGSRTGRTGDVSVKPNRTRLRPAPLRQRLGNNNPNPGP